MGFFLEVFFCFFIFYCLVSFPFSSSCYPIHTVADFPVHTYELINTHTHYLSHRGTVSFSPSHSLSNSVTHTHTHTLGLRRRPAQCPDDKLCHNSPPWRKYPSVSEGVDNGCHIDRKDRQTTKPDICLVNKYPSLVQQVENYADLLTNLLQAESGKLQLIFLHHGVSTELGFLQCTLVFVSHIMSCFNMQPGKWRRYRKGCW